MAQKRSELRQKSMVILYQREIMKKNNIDFDIDKIIEDNLEISSEFVKDMVYGIITNENELESIANSHLKNWTIDRLDISGSSILKMGIYELIYMDTPQIVVINEMINLSKLYCDDDIRKVINGVLDKVMKEHER